MARRFVASLAVLFVLPAAIDASAQESPPPIARQQTVAERPYQEIASPMLLEVSLGATPRRRSIQELDTNHLWIATETNRYICQQVQIRAIEVRKEENRSKVKLHIVAVLRAQESPKDVDVTVSMVSDTKEVQKKFWHEFTADPITRHPRNPETEFDFSTQEFAALFGPGRAPSVRVVLNILE